MARTIMLRIDPTATEASWQRLENGQLAGSFHQGKLADAYRHCRGANVIVLVPSEEVFITRLPLPGKNRKKLLRAVPYAIEDQLVDEIEALHFALSPQPVAGEYIVAAVETRLMDFWDSALKQASIRAETMIPDSLALLDSTESWSLLLESTRALVRSPIGMFSSNIENLPFMLNNLYRQSAETPPAEVAVYDCSRASYLDSLQTLCPDIPFSVQECSDGVFGIFSQHYDATRSVNLLQGSYNRQEGIGKHLRPWYPAAALCAIWLAWQLIVNITAIVDYGRQSDELTEQMKRVYQTTFVGSKVPAPGYERSSMESRLNQLLEKKGQSRGSLQEMLVKTAPVLKNMKDITLDSMRFNNGKLDIDLTVKRAADVEPLREKLEQQTGWEVKSNASTSKGVTRVRLNIKSNSAT